MLLKKNINKTIEMIRYQIKKDDIIIAYGYDKILECNENNTDDGYRMLFKQEYTKNGIWIQS